MTHPSRLPAVLALTLLAGCGGGLDFDWPPQVGQRYPDVTLRGLDGERVSLSDFEGKVLLIEPIGMT